MERKGLINKELKGHSISTSVDQKSSHKKIIVNKDPWDTYGEDIFRNGVSWPPRAYICTFCAREFKSAQALGGHMNVHRRDRARLRQSPPPPTPPSSPSLDLIDLNNHPNTNPSPTNPNFPSSSLASSSPPTSSIPIFFSTLPPSASCGGAKEGDAAHLTGLEGLNKIGTRLRGKKFTREEDYINGLARSGVSSVSLDLGIGQLGDSMGDVDLELRLGYP